MLFSEIFVLSLPAVLLQLLPVPFVLCVNDHGNVLHFQDQIRNDPAASSGTSSITPSGGMR
jgi:hypothetical protein